MAAKNLKDRLLSNWRSGLTVALVSIPLSVSLAVASGTSPVAGIVTGIWAGLITSFLGGSNYNIVGPTGALSGILASFAFAHGAGILPVLAIFTGIFILVAYALRLERYLIFVPASTIHGFTLGVAFIIGLNQLNNALGLTGLKVHEKFFENLIESLTHIGNLSVPTFLIFALFLALLFIFAKKMPKLPGAIILTPIGIFLGYLSTKGLLPFTLVTLSSKYPDLSPALFIKPEFSFNEELISISIAVALIAVIETMISAKIADGMTKTKHNGRKEMLALGLANIGSGLMGGIPATAALARTSLNIKTGATHKISATISSLGILLISMLMLGFFKFIPLAVIGAILVFVAVRMVEREHFYSMWKHEKKSFVISMVVAFITIYEDPIIGILAGTVIALLLFMERLSYGHFDASISDSTGTIQKITAQQVVHDITDCETLVYSIKGALVYVNAQAHISRFENGVNGYKCIILRLRELSFIDLDGIDALDQIIDIIRGHGRKVYLTGVSPHIEKHLEDSENYKELKENGFVREKTTEVIKELSK